MKKAVIIGFGRFGKLLADLGKDTFDISVIESDPVRQEEVKELGYRLITFDSLTSVEFVFLTVPISRLEDVIKELAKFVDERHVIVDLCSVKVYPARLMIKYLVKSSLLATHPMFGPDSAKQGLAGLQVAFCPLRVEDDKKQILKDFWENQGARVVETTPEQHDRDTAYSQAFTYSLARIILNTNVPTVELQTRSFSRLMDVAHLSANDSEQLFHDMLLYNPYYAAMKAQLIISIKKTMHRLSEIETEQISIPLFDA